jgi:hypothetical protein
MKPAFALDFRNDAIALLHRAAGGWHQVGRVTFDEPDLPAALGYLRSTALGLSPRGLATKLILPDDQILMTVVEAPGPDDASRAAQIRVALEGRTPYPVEDLVFDWEIVGGEVRVAVVARDTLAEAEAFAVEHRFNPVAFVGAPASGFAAEPWFGPTAHAAEVLAAGEMLERDSAQVTVLARGFDEGAVAEPEPAPLPETKPEAQPEPAPLPEMPEAEPDLPKPEPEPDLPAPEETAPEELAPEELAPEDPAPDEPDWPEAAPDEVAAEPVHDLPADLPPEPYAPPLREPREAPVFGLADDEPAPSEVFRARPADYLPPAFDPVFDPVDDLPDDLAATLRDIALDDEAPMAVDVEDDLPGGDMGADLVAGAPAGPRITDPAIQDDVPPVPGYSPAMSFASRRASVTEGGAPKLAAPPPRPAVARPVGAKPLPPAAPKPERPMVDRPTAVNLAPQREKPRENKGLRGLGALVTAPGLPGSRKKVMIPAPSPAVASPLEVNPGASAATLSPAAPAAAEAEARRPATAQNAKGPANHGLGTGRPATRGKPRYLGLILTAVLLIVLAVIAAWSTSLAFRSEDGAEVQQAAADTEVPAPEDEMAADGELPEAEAAPEPAAESAQIDTPAPVDTSEAAAAEVEGLDGTPAPGSATAGDEIVLATSDSLPDTPAPVDLPEATAQGDPMPLAQAPPPPFGTVYQFDANGLIVPTPEGIITPEGVRLVAGKPPRVPQPRPEGLAPAVPEVAPEAAAEAPPEPAAVAADAETLAPAATFEADPALARFRPKTRPEGLVPPVQLNEAAAPESDTDTAADATSSDNRLAGLRPKARPGAVLAAGEAALTAKAASAASLTAQAETAAAASSGSPLAVAISRRPAARPQDLSRAVEAAVAAAVRTPEPQPEPEPEPAPTQTASLVAKAAPKAKPEPEPEPEPQPTKKAKAKSTLSGRDKNSEAEADDEPELEAAPKSKSGGSVAKQATFKNALAMDKTSLIGVYGTPSNRYAMIRTSNGRYKKVKIGDSVDGGRVQAITATEVRYQKGSRLVTLSLPRG